MSSSGMMTIRQRQCAPRRIVPDLMSAMVLECDEGEGALWQPGQWDGARALLVSQANGCTIKGAAVGYGLAACPLDRLGTSFRGSRGCAVFKRKHFRWVLLENPTEGLAVLERWTVTGPWCPWKDGCVETT
jgi:hypothetical protein